jgi:diguanylate cyclase (GGDEF)-like protein
MYRIINVASVLFMLMIIVFINKYNINIKPVADLSKDWIIKYDNKQIVDEFRYNSDKKVSTEKNITLINKFLIPSDNKDTGLWISIGKLNGSYKLYVNDIFLGQSGEMPPDYDSGWTNLGFFLLPDIALNRNGENTIRLEYYCDYSSGFRSKPMIMDYKEYRRAYFMARFLNYTVYIIIMTLLAAISIFFLFIYRNSIKEKYILYFSIITASLFIYYNSYVWTSYWNSGFVVLKITESALFVAIILLIYFIKNYLGLSINRLDRILHYVQMAIVGGSLLIPNVGVYNQFRRIFHTVVIVNLVYFIYIAAKAVIAKASNSRYFFIITVTALIMIVHDSIPFIIGDSKKYALFYDFSISEFIIPIIIINLALAFALKIEELQNCTVQYSVKLKSLNHMLKDIIDENNMLYSKTITDYLTGTYNRNFLEISYKKQMEEMRVEETYALFFIDIDNFRDFNNNYGHDVGDFVLTSFVNIINDELEPIDIFVRYSGDEFVILMYNSEPFRHRNVARKILQRLQESEFEYKEKNYKISCSIGVKLIKSNKISLESALKFADMAMYRAKASGKNSYYVIE